MPGVNMPGQRQGLLDQVAKGLAIARDIFGIKHEMTQDDTAAIQQQGLQQQQDQSAKLFEDEQAGILKPKDYAETRAKYAGAKEGEDGAFQISKRGPDGSVLSEYVKERAAATPLTHIANVKDPGGSGMLGTAIVDGAGNIKGFVPQEKDKAPKELKTREIKTVDPTTGEEVIQIVEDRPGQTFKSQPPKDKNITKDQFAVAGFAKRMQQAENIFGDLQQSGFDRTSSGAGIASLSPIQAMKPDALIAQEQAERNFVNAVLRRESGAAISKEEFSNAEKQYFPRAGDTADVLAQKQQNRGQAIASFKAEAGKALSEIPDVPLQKPRGDTSGKAYAGGGKAAPNAALHPEADQAKAWASKTLSNPKASDSDRAKATAIMQRLSVGEDRPDMPQTTQGSM